MWDEDSSGLMNNRPDYCEITICEVLPTLIVREGTKGTENGNAYTTFTFTRYPGALHVPVEHRVHVVGVPALGVYQVVVTVIFDEFMPGYPRPLT